MHTRLWLGNLKEQTNHKTNVYMGRQYYNGSTENRVGRYGLDASGLE